MTDKDAFSTLMKFWDVMSDWNLSPEQKESKNPVRTYEQIGAIQRILRLLKIHIEEAEKGNPCIRCKHHCKQRLLGGTYEWTCSHFNCLYSYDGVNPRESED